MLSALGVAGVSSIAGCGAQQAQTPSDSKGNEENSDSGSEGLAGAKETTIGSIGADPTELPSSLDRDEPTDVEIELEATEQVAEIEDGSTFRYMTFGDQVPGPMIRLMEGDRVTLTLTFNTNSQLLHNIDSHGIYGPGGGAEDTTVAPGESATITFTAEYVGAFIYHCAVPNMTQHISAGMFGIFVVEPRGGLPEVDREFYLGRNEVYTTGDTGDEGHHEFNMEAMKNLGSPTYFPMNGTAETTELTAQRGERVRVFFVCGGPNYETNFHPIGNVIETLYPTGSFRGETQHNVETTVVPPGAATVAEMNLPVPGPIKLVDHALTRTVSKGSLAVLSVEGEENSDVYAGNSTD
jgi:nitrite reductase (NO-forming)